MKNERQGIVQMGRGENGNKFEGMTDEEQDTWEKLNYGARMSKIVVEG